MVLHKKWLTVSIIILGGVAVLSSYGLVIFMNANARQALWGGIPPQLRVFYTTGMLLSALGFFAYTYFILFRLPAECARVTRWFGYGIFNLLYAGILIPSALWLPLTVWATVQASPLWVWITRLDLAVVALASLALLAALWVVRPRTPTWAHRLGVIGCGFFCIQTVVLDALIWGINFSV